jgi:ribosomal protein L11 methyltransferase
MNYYLFQWEVPVENRDMLLAFLGELPFEVFEETDAGIAAYLPESEDNFAIEEAVSELANRFASTYQKTFLPSQNWNSVWESNFQPVIVDDFCGIRAEFHDTIEGVQHELVIQPRMAFGTGHHATTEMMIRAMQTFEFHGKSVFDYGCGTGILAILAGKLGAMPIDAVDIETESYENTIHNALLNSVAHIKTYCGTLQTVPPSTYDFILANINRNVLLQSMAELALRLKENGVLLLSGILQSDVAVIQDAAAACGLFPFLALQQADWVCLGLRRK